jgi:hypothetical protein
MDIAKRRDEPLATANFRQRHNPVKSKKPIDRF